jgi:hypothetical protein
MNMKAALPPDFKPPFWATKEFRRFLLVGVMGLAVVAVVIVDIAPKLTTRPTRVEKHDANAFVPQAAVEGAPKIVKFEGVLAKAKDGTPIDDQDEPYQYLIRSLSRMDAALVAKDAKPVDYKYYSKMPVEMRGETVKILALFLQSNPIRVDAAPGGVKFIHRTYLSDLSGAEGYVVDLLEPPGEDLAKRTVVGMDAVFLKLGTYEGRNGSVQAPLFIAKSLRTVREKMADSTAQNLSGGAILGIAAGLLVVMLVLTSFMFRKSKPAPPRNPAISLDPLKT